MTIPLNTIIIALVSFFSFPYGNYGNKVLSGCTNDDSTDFQLTASGYHVQSNVSCVSVCNSYMPPIFEDAFFLEGQLCFCRNASLPILNISTINTCVTSTCLNDNSTSDCSLSNYAFFSLSLGIIDWSIIFKPNVTLVDKEVQIQTNILKGDASNAIVTPLLNGLPLMFQSNIDSLTVKTMFYLPGLQMWSQTLENRYADPFKTISWLQIDEYTGGIYVVPSTELVNDFYNFFLVITEGTNVSVNLHLPMNKVLYFTADVLRFSYGSDRSLLNAQATNNLKLSSGYVLQQAILTSGHFTKLIVKAFATGYLQISILRPLLDNYTDFCLSVLDCSVNIFSNTSITAVVVKQFIFYLNGTGVIEIPIIHKLSNVQENDLVWIGGDASLFCNGSSFKEVQGEGIGKIIKFSTNQMSNGFYITLFISKLFEYLIPIPSSSIGFFTFTVDVFSHVSPLKKLNYSFPIQIPISGLQFDNQTVFPSVVAGYIFNNYLVLKAVINNGSGATYLFDIPELNYSMNTSSGISTPYKLTKLGTFTVYVTAGNKFNSLNTSTKIAVLSEINSVSMSVEINQLQYRSFNSTVTVYNGNSVLLLIDFGDGSPVQNVSIIDATGEKGFIYTFSYGYPLCNPMQNIFNITVNASNVLVKGNKPTVSSKFTNSFITLYCKLSPLNIVTSPVVSLNGYVLISPNKSIIVTISQDKGSYRNYSIDWGDGSYISNDQSSNFGPVSFQVQHVYTSKKNFTISVISRNYLEFINKSIKVWVEDCSIPDASFYYGTVFSPLSIIQSDGASLTAVVANPESTCPLVIPTFQWNLVNSNFSKPTVGTLVQQKVIYTIQKNELDFGIYNLTLTYNYGLFTNVYIAYLNVTYSSLIMNIDQGFLSSVAYKKMIDNQTLHHNFTINADSSYDPDEQTIKTQNINFVWRCKLASNFSDAEEAKANFTALNLNYTSDTCYNESWLSLSSGNDKLNFSTQQFLEGINYYIEVCGTKYAGKNVDLNTINKTGCFVQKLLIIPRSLPTVSVRCVSNCDDKINFKERVIYTFGCDDCGMQPIGGRWKIEDDNGNKPNELSVWNATTTGFATPSLVINKDVLLESKTYTFITEIGYADSSRKVKFSFTKSTCSKPTPGVCYANPTDGIALKTLFNIVCNDWKDLDGFLRYMFYYDNGQTQYMKVSSSTTIDYPILNPSTTDEPSLINFMMGPGDEKNLYQVNIIIKVSNKYQAFTRYKPLHIKVRPNNEYINVTDLIAGINLNDTQSLANLVQAVSSSTNKMSANYSNSTLPVADNITGFVDNDALNLQKQQHLTIMQESRTHMVGLLSNATINDLNSFKTIGDALALTSQNPTELVPHSQQQATDIIAKMAGLLTTENLKGVGADKFDTMTQPFLKSISNLFQTNNNQSDPGFSSLQTTTTTTTTMTTVSTLQGNNSNKVLQLLKSLDQHFIAAQTYKVPGENATVGETNQFSFVLKKDFSSNLSRKSIVSSDGASEYGFTLPDSNDLFNESVQNSQLLVQNVRMKNNAYTWDSNRSQNILSESQSLSFSDANGKQIKVSNTSKPINIAIKNIPEKLIGKKVSLTMPNEVSLFTLPLPSGCNMLLKFLFLNDQSNLTNLIVYIQYGKVATKLDYDIMVNISAKRGVVMTKNSNFPVLTNKSIMNFFEVVTQKSNLSTDNISISSNLNNISNFQSNNLTNTSTQLNNLTQVNNLTQANTLTQVNTLTQLNISTQSNTSTQTSTLTQLNTSKQLNTSNQFNISTQSNTLTQANTLTQLNNLTQSSTSSKSNTLTAERNQDVRLLDDGTLILWNFLNSTYGFNNTSNLYLLFSYGGPMPPKKLDLNPYTFDEAEYPGTFDYEMKSFCAECNYWNEDENRWMSDGCKVDLNNTSFLTTKCKCTHLTAFGGFFVAPNPIKLPTLASLKDGYVLLVTVAIVLLLWIVGLIFSRKIDKKDHCKVGVCPLIDNRDEDNYMYEIIVNTGNRKNAGTKSNIFFSVTGDINNSEVRRLKDLERNCFQRSSCDMFIMTTPSSLGDLDYIRLWHDNSGGAWYVKDITIIDLQTEKQFLFMGNRWLAVDCGSVDCVIPVASVEEQKDFTYVFTSRAKNGLSDKHLWFSVFARPPKSNFTRCQRLTVAVSLLMTSMMVSTMFYKNVVDKPNTIEDNKGVFAFTKTQIFVILISTFVKFPIHFLLVKLFCSLRTFKNHNKNKSSQSVGCRSPKDSSKHSSEDSSKHSSSSEAITKQSFSSEDSTKHSSSFEDSSKHLSSSEDSSKHSSSSEDISKHLFSSEDSSKHLSSSEDIIKHSSSSEDSSLNNKSAKMIVEDKLSKKKNRKKLPHWCLYVAWLFCVANILVCSAIVLLYGMQFGNKTSLNWLASVTIDLAKEIFFTEPIKVFVFSILFALILKSIDDEESEVVTEGKMLAHDENWLHKPKYELCIFNREDIKLQPPDSSQLLKMRDLRLKNLKMLALTQEFAFYMFYAGLVMYIGYTTRGKFTFYQTRNVQDLFNLTLRRTPWPRDYSNIFSQIQSSQDFWPWMEKYFLLQVFPKPWFNLSNNNTNKNFPGKLFLNDLNSKIISGIRVRQVRVRPNSCMKYKSVAQFFKIDCMSPYKNTFEETRDFYFDWKLPSIYNSTIDPFTKPWRYQTWQELDGYPYAANIDTYNGGGYVIEIFPKWDNKAMLDKVKLLKWVDRQTRAVIIEFALFNAATKYFSMVIMFLEFPASGGIVPSFSILTFSLYTPMTESKFTLFSHIFFAMITLYFIFRECRFVYRVGCKYFLEFWNLVEFVLVLLSIIAVGFFFYKDHLGKDLLQRLPSKKPQSFINFQFASYWDLTFEYIVSLIVFFVTLKFIKLLRFNRRVSVLSSTLKAAWYPLSIFSIMFFIIMCSVVATSSIVFGAFLDGYRTHFKAIASIISLLLGKFSYNQFQNANRLLGPIFFFGFNILVNWIVMTMFLAILNDAFEEVNEELKHQENEYEIIDFIMGNFKDWLGWNNIKKKEDSLISQNKPDNNQLSSTTCMQKITLNNSPKILKCNDNLSVTLLQKPIQIKCRNNVIFNGVNANVYSVERMFEPDTAISDHISRLSEYDFLIKEKEYDTGATEVLAKFINCMNLVYNKSCQTKERKNIANETFERKNIANETFERKKVATNYWFD